MYQGFYCLDGVNRLFTMPFEDGDVKPFKSSGAEGCDGNAVELEGESRSVEAEDESGGHREIDGSTDVDADSLDEDTCDKESTASHRTSARNNIGSSSSSGGGIKVPLDKEGKTKLTMWQLSFSDFTEEEGIRLRSASAEDLLKEALRRCNGWFDPVCDMINCTPKKEVWGTGLYDRNPMALRGKDQGSRVTVMGDACHPMSMFKGQGANQALHDGPLLASWLDCGSGNGNATKKTKKNQTIVSEISGTVSANTHRNIAENSKLNKAVSSELTNQNIYTRLRCFEREMVARTSSKVQASREAATQLHSPAVLSDSFRVEGVKAEMHGPLLQKLKILDIGAHLSSDLEGKLRNVLQELTSNILCQ